MSALGPEHISRVRVLFKAILRLHRGLPPELKAFGDEYVRDEFKRHRSAEAAFVPQFMECWTDYAITLAQQIGKKSSIKQLGVSLSEKQVELMSEDQVGQLFELFKETQKPVNPDNPLGENPYVKPSKDGS